MCLGEIIKSVQHRHRRRPGVRLELRTAGIPSEIDIQRMATRLSECAGGRGANRDCRGDNADIPEIKMSARRKSSRHSREKLRIRASQIAITQRIYLIDLAMGRAVQSRGERDNTHLEAFPHTHGPVTKAVIPVFEDPTINEP